MIKISTLKLRKLRLRVEQEITSNHILSELIWDPIGTHWGSYLNSSGMVSMKDRTHHHRNGIS